MKDRGWFLGSAAAVWSLGVSGMFGPRLRVDFRQVQGVQVSIPVCCVRWRVVL